MNIVMNLSLIIISTSVAGYLISKKIEKIDADIENLYSRLEIFEEFMAKKDMPPIESRYDSDCDSV